MNTDFHGRGMTFPLRLGVAGISESAGAAKVEESIRIVLGTQYGERLMRPRFGCNLRSLAFAPNNTATANLARHYVAEGIGQSEPRVEVVDVAVTNVLDDGTAGGTLLITVSYRLRGTQDVRTLVYPFYLERPQ